MKVVARGREMFAECIAEGQKSGEINRRWSPLDILINVMFEEF